MSAVAEGERAARHLAERSGIDAEPVRARLQACDAPFDEIEGAGHGTEVDPFAGGAALDIRHIADQGFLAVPPGVGALLAREHPAVHQAAEGRTMTGAIQVVGDRRAPRLVVEPVSETVEQGPQLGRVEEIAEHECVGLLGRLIAVDRVPLGLQDPVEPTDVAVSGAVGLPVQFGQLAIALELADDPAVERYVQPTGDVLPAAQRPVVQAESLGQLPSTGLGKPPNSSSARASTQAAVTLVYALSSIPGAAAPG